MGELLRDKKLPSWRVLQNYYFRGLYQKTYIDKQYITKNDMRFWQFCNTLEFSTINGTLNERAGINDCGF